MVIGRDSKGIKDIFCPYYLCVLTRLGAVVTRAYCHKDGKAIENF